MKKTAILVIIGLAMVGGNVMSAPVLGYIETFDANSAGWLVSQIGDGAPSVSWDASQSVQLTMPDTAAPAARLYAVASCHRITLVAPAAFQPRTALSL